ncbi:hypothetical protein [Klebsiella quasipneumoniae]|uniref:hypothetical protein n=1 Tax=Klebsiella quasipneumoniae TaxID=1463165 RepID=UPI0021D90833|nr:hypothetical protein [Klebsiella quasipneumoniae]MCU8824780.1 hypothetical protein [Klebsiella quasipneumoniae]
MCTGNVDSCELAADLLLSELSLSVEAKHEVKKRLIKCHPLSESAAVKQLSYFLSDTSSWPRGKSHLEKQLDDPDDYVTAEDLSALLFQVYVISESRIFRFRQIKETFENAVDSEIRYDSAKVYTNDHDASCGLKDGQIINASEVLAKLNNPICEHLDCSCTFVLQSKIDKN